MRYNLSDTRQLNEQEVRAAATLLFMATMLTRRTIAGWSLRKNKPTKDELYQMMRTLHGAEEAVARMANSPPGDGQPLASMFDVIRRETERLEAEIKEESNQ